MASGDNLRDLLDIARRELPDVPAEVWERLMGVASRYFPATRLYVASQRKRRQLEALARLDEEASNAELARMLGVSVRHAKRVKRLR
ncbi:MAG: hypothetical protein AB1409_08150 [Pseudomonadota bacterium]